MDPILSEQNDYQVGVGQRNSALFTLGCQLRTAWRETWEPEIVLEVLKTVNNVFFQEPLVHDEVETIFTSVMKRPESIAHEKLTGQIISNSIKMKFEGLLFCTTKPLQWYNWKDGYWRETPMVVLESIIFTEIRDINEESLKSALVNEVKFVLERDLAEETREYSGMQAFLPIEGKINFRNGVFDTKTMKLLPHDSRYKFFSKLPIDYNIQAYPNEKLKKLLLNFVNGDNVRLELLRGLIRRAIEPAPQLQTGFWIYGPPGTGKSSFVNWLLSIVLNLGTEMVSKSGTLFTNARLIGKTLIVVSDLEGLSKELLRLFKTVTGRDPIPYDWKH